MLNPSRMLVQALMVLRHFPDTWLDFAAWHTRVGGAKSAPAAIEVLSRAVKVCANLARAPTYSRSLQQHSLHAGQGLVICMHWRIHSK